MLAIVYVRVSTEEQAKHGYSLDAQREACRVKAYSLGAKEIKDFADEGVSGEILARPGLESALQAIKESRAELFVCLDPDRLSRKLAHQLIITEEIEKAGCRLEFVNFDWKDTPEGRLFYSLRGAIAEYEKEKIVARSKMGRLAKAKKGEKPHHLPTYGYREEPGKLVINDQEASVVRQMFAWAAAGDGPHVIARRLTEMGIPGPRGGKWYRGVIARILKNPAYMGLMYVNRYDCTGLLNNKYLPPGQKLRKRERPHEEWIPLAVPAIVDAITWERAQAARARRRKMINEQYLLSGLVRCGVCGQPVWGTSYRGKNGKTYKYYLCASKKNNFDRQQAMSCNMSHIQAAPLDDVVWGVVAGWLCNPEKLLNEMRSPERKAEIECQIKEIVKEITTVSAERKRAFAAYTKGLVDEQMYMEVAREIKRRQESLAARLARLQEELSTVDPTGEDLESLKELAMKYAGRIDELTFEEKSRIVHLLVERVTVTDTRVEIQGRVPREAFRYSGSPTVVGDPVETPDGTVIIPISRVACGFGAGGGELEPEGRQMGEGEQMPFFGGGSGAGVSVQPVGFLVVGQGQIRLLPVDSNVIIDRIIDLAPQVLSQIQSMFKRDDHQRAAIMGSPPPPPPAATIPPV